VIGLHGNYGQTSYAASKAGIIGFTKSLAKEIASRGITVNAIAPGYIKTEMTEALPDKIREALVAQIPMGYGADPWDVAQTVTFLLSDRARYITGEVVRVDGGFGM
jgi:3-oxoacyl-[acyl-carrier protein] reductase